MGKQNSKLGEPFSKVLSTFGYTATLYTKIHNCLNNPLLHIHLHVSDYLDFKPNIGELFSHVFEILKNDSLVLGCGKSLSFVKFSEGIARSHAFSHAPYHYRVSRVLRDGITKKRDTACRLHGSIKWAM